MVICIFQLNSSLEISIIYDIEFPYPMTTLGFNVALFLAVMFCIFIIFYSNLKNITDVSPGHVATNLLYQDMILPKDRLFKYLSGNDDDIDDAPSSRNLQALTSGL